MADRRTSPTPPHNTREFATWVDFAETALTALADYPADVRIAKVSQELEHYRQLFSGWSADEAKRPTPTDRLPYMNAFMLARGRALDLLKTLAKQYPEIAARAGARHRAEAERNRQR